MNKRTAFLLQKNLQRALRIINGSWKPPVIEKY